MNHNEQHPESTATPNLNEELDPTLATDEAVNLDFQQLEENPMTVLEDENGRLKDQLLRMAAEMENLRRRATEDVNKAHKFAIEKFADGLLPVHESLEKAVQDNSGDLNAMREGVELTFKQLIAALEKGGVFELNPKGEKFDPHFHQAISMIPSEMESGCVVEVLQKGFKINDRVLRPALVIVAQ